LENLYGVSKNHAESLKTPLEFQKSMGIFKNRNGVSKISMEFQYSFELQLSVGVLNHQKWWQLWYPHFWRFKTPVSISNTVYTGIADVNMM
jgi:hypothetical protein